MYDSILVKCAGWANPWKADQWLPVAGEATNQYQASFGSDKIILLLDSYGQPTL